MTAPYRVYVISARRPGNVPGMQSRLGPAEPVTWVVPDGEAADYRLAGARSVLPVPAPTGAARYLPVQRNAALDNARDRGVVCVQTDDDLRRLYAPVWPPGDAKPVRVTITWAQARKRLIDALGATGAYLAGVNPTTNLLDVINRPETVPYGFVRAALCAIDARHDVPRFDDTLPLKEDYDYSCRHLATYGALVRCNWLLADYSYGTNRGGVVTYRNPQLEAETMGLLVGRWPQYLRPHHRRQGELSFLPRRRGAPKP